MTLTKPLRILFASMTIYLLLTLSEVIIHKYIMHNEPGSWAAWLYGDNHNRHHRVVLDDMKLNMESEDHDIGLFFDSTTVLEMTFGFTLPFYAIFKLWGLNVSLKFCYGLSLAVSLFYKFMWDWLHYSFHQIKDLDLDFMTLIDQNISSYVETTPLYFDAIIIDLFNPAGSLEMSAFMKPYFTKKSNDSRKWSR